MVEEGEEEDEKMRRKMRMGPKGNTLVSLGPRAGGRGLGAEGRGREPRAGGRGPEAKRRGPGTFFLCPKLLGRSGKQAIAASVGIAPEKPRTVSWHGVVGLTRGALLRKVRQVRAGGAALATKACLRPNFFESWNSKPLL